VVARRAGERAPLETAVAALLVVVAPALAVGTLEGEQAGLVLSALATIGLALLGGRLATRRALAPATAGKTGR
jgi:hypothetical protein